MKAKKLRCAVLLTITVLGMTGCMRVGNKGWSDMTEQERAKAREEFHAIREEVAEDFPEDSLERRLTEMILNRVENHLGEDD